MRGGGTLQHPPTHTYFRTRISLDIQQNQPRTRTHTHSNTQSPINQKNTHHQRTQILHTQSGTTEINSAVGAINVRLDSDPKRFRMTLSDRFFHSLPIQRGCIRIQGGTQLERYTITPRKESPLPLARRGGNGGILQPPSVRAVQIPFEHWAKATLFPCFQCGWRVRWLPSQPPPPPERF